MKKVFLLISISVIMLATNAQDLQTDRYETDKGELLIHFVKHGSLFLEFDNKIIHIDPVSGMGEYENYPKADLILITHHHSDHFDYNAISMLSNENTKVIFTQLCSEYTEGLKSSIVVKNGDILSINEIEIEAVPAYNILHKRDNGKLFHPKGEGNGYIIKLGDKSVYIAGDTENIPEMTYLENIDIAFLPMNLPYTMTPEMVANAVNMFNPKFVYPYHYGKTDTQKIIDLLKDKTETKVLIKKM